MTEQDDEEEFSPVGWAVQYAERLMKGRHAKFFRCLGFKSSASLLVLEFLTELCIYLWDLRLVLGIWVGGLMMLLFSGPTIKNETC